MVIAFTKLYSQRRGVSSAFAQGVNLAVWPAFQVEACEALVECSLNQYCIYSEHMSYLAKMVTNQPLMAYEQRLRGVVGDFNQDHYTEYKLIAWWSLCGELACEALNCRPQELGAKLAAVLRTMVTMTNEKMGNINWGIFVDYQRCIRSWDFVPRCWYKATIYSTAAVSGMLEAPFRQAAAYPTFDEAVSAGWESVAKFREEAGLSQVQFAQMQLTVRVQEMPTTMKYLNLENDPLNVDNDSNSEGDSSMDTSVAETEPNEDDESFDTEGSVSLGSQDTDNGGHNNWDDGSAGESNSGQENVDPLYFQ